MKKNFLFGLFATAMLLLTTACQKENDLANGNEVMVNFEVSTPEIATRAYSDGKTATNLQYAVYNSKKEQLTTMKFADNQIGVGEKDFTLKTNVSMRLALGNEYYVLFWAEADGAPYTVDFAGKTLTVNYDGAKSNDENRDAFYCWKKVTDQELRDGSVSIEMRRPFAQLNIGTGDTKEALASGVTAKTTAVKVKAYKEMNFSTGEVLDLQDVVFDYANVPTDEKFPVDHYDYLAMNYLLVGADKEVINEVVFQYTIAENNKIETRTFTSIPVRRNYRTNIYGNLLTQAVDFNVEIKPEYLGAENQGTPYVSLRNANGEYLGTNYATIEEALENVTNEYNTIVLNGYYELKNVITVAKDQTLVLDLNGYNMHMVDATEAAFEMINNAGNLTIQGEGKLTVEATINNGWSRRSAVVSNVPGGNLTVKDGAVIEHLGGTDMAYGIDNLTNGKGTYAVTTIEDATIKSTYSAIRQFLNGIEATNELYVKNGATLVSPNRAIFFQDPSKNPNTGKLVVEAGAQVTGKVHLSVTEGSTEWPVEVSVAESALVNGSQVTNNFTPEGYAIVLENGVYVVKSGVFSTLEGLKDALANGEDVILGADVKVANSEVGNNGYGAIGISQLNGGVIDGNGHSVSVDAWGTWDSAINTTGGTIKNMFVTGGMRGIFVNHNSTYSDKVILDNVTIDGTVYTISCDQGTGKGLDAVNSTFNGWTSYAATIGNVTFTGCSFGEGQGYAFCRPYAPTVFTNCDFAAGYEIDARAKVTFDNCRLNGVAITAENYTSLVTSNQGNVAFLANVSNSADLAAALTSGAEKVYLSAGEYTMPAGSSFTKNTTLVCAEGTVFTGNSKLNINGATIIGATFSNPSGTAVDQTINGTFKGCKFEGANGARWCYAGETVVFEDCVFSGSTYGVHFDGGANDVIFRNCTISGFNALAGDIEMVTFEGCTFKGNGKSAYNGANLWGSAKMINCEFTFNGTTANEWIDCIGTDKTYEFTNCTVNGIAFTAENYTTYSENIFSRNHGKVKINGVDCQM